MASKKNTRGKSQPAGQPSPAEPSVDVQIPSEEAESAGPVAPPNAIADGRPELYVIDPEMVEPRVTAQADSPYKTVKDLALTDAVAVDETHSEGSREGNPREIPNVTHPLPESVLTPAPDETYLAFLFDNQDKERRFIEIANAAVIATTDTGSPELGYQPAMVDLYCEKGVEVTTLLGYERERQLLRVVESVPFLRSGGKVTMHRLRVTPFNSTYFSKGSIRPGAQLFYFE